MTTTAYVTSIETKHATLIYLGTTQAACDRQVAAYCRDGWADAIAYAEGEEERDPDTMTDREVIDFYFADDQMGPHETLTDHDTRPVETASSDMSTEQRNACVAAMSAHVVAAAVAAGDPKELSWYVGQWFESLDDRDLRQEMSDADLLDKSAPPFPHDAIAKDN